jgi:hypothetical protein
MVIMEVGKNIAAAFIAVCDEVENVVKDANGQVGNQKYRYATLAAVLDMLDPIFKKHGLRAPQSVHGDELRTTLVHKSGETWDMGNYPLGNLVKQQERGSAISYGRRYVLVSVFGIAQEDDDGEAASKAKPASNTPTNGDKTAQAEFGSATEFKKYYNETMDAIKRLPGKDAAGVINKRIDRIAKVDDQCTINLNDALELRLDELHMQG